MNGSKPHYRKFSTASLPKEAVWESGFCSRLETLGFSNSSDFVSVAVLGIETDRQGRAVVVQADNMLRMKLKYYVGEDNGAFNIKSVYALQNGRWRRYYF